jgi:hypothetical protein
MHQNGLDPNAVFPMASRVVFCNPKMNLSTRHVAARLSGILVVFVVLAKSCQTINRKKDWACAIDYFWERCS